MGSVDAEAHEMVPLESLTQENSNQIRRDEPKIQRNERYAQIFQKIMHYVKKIKLVSVVMKKGVQSQMAMHSLLWKFE